MIIKRIGILSVILIILSIVLAGGYSRYNENIKEDIVLINIKEYQATLLKKYKLFLEEAKTTIPKKSYNSLVGEIQKQEENIQNFEEYKNLTSFKAKLINEENKNLIEKKDKDVKEYKVVLARVLSLIDEIRTLPKNEIPGYFVLLQVVVDNMFNMDLDIQKKYNDEDVKIAFLTFDDGPTSNTEKILEILEENDVRGTFFMIGNRLELFPEQVEEVIEQGSSIGLHGYTHMTDKYDDKTGDTILKEMNHAHRILEEKFGYETSIVRIPTGSIILDKKQKEKLIRNGYKVIDWNVDSEDWSSNTSKEVYNNVKSSLNSDVEVILFHEKDVTLEVLPKVIALLRNEDYYIVNIPSKYSEDFMFENIY